MNLLAMLATFVLIGFCGGCVYAAVRACEDDPRSPEVRDTHDRWRHR